MAGVKVAEAFVEFIARKGKNFGKVAEEVKQDAAKAAEGASTTAQGAKTAAQAWAEMTAGMETAAPAAAGASAALGPVAIGVAAVAAGLFLVAKALPALKQAADEMKELKVIGDVAGYSASELTAMAYAMEHAGGTMHDVIALKSAWNSQMLDLSYGTGRAGAAMRMLGVSALDAKGQLRDVREVLPELAAAMEKYGASDRQRLAEAIFGGASEGFLKLVAQGKDSLKQMSLDARALGLQANDATIAAGAQVSDTWNTLLAELKALWRNLVALASPILVPLLALLISLLGILNFMLSAVNSLIIRPITALFSQIFKVFQWGNRMVDMVHNKLGWLKKIADWLYGGNNAKEDAQSHLGLSQIRAITGSGVVAGVGGFTDYARNLITMVTGKTDVGAAQLAELKSHTALLQTIAGGTNGEVAMGI